MHVLNEITENGLGSSKKEIVDEIFNILIEKHDVDKKIMNSIVK